MLESLNYETKRQAETFFKVMVAKRYSPQQIADILGHMGGMFVEYSKDIVGRSHPTPEGS